MIAIGLTTCHRPDFPLADSIRRLRIGGFDQDVHVFAEPGTGIEHIPGVVVHCNRDTLGVNRNAQQAMRFLLGLSTDYVLLVENDVEFSPNAAAHLGMMPEWFGFASLYTPVLYADAIGYSRGWVEYNRGWYNCAGQAILFQSNVLRMILQDERWETAGMDGCGNGDSIIGSYCQERYIPCYHHVPSLCEHLGRKSSRSDVPVPDVHSGWLYGEA